MYLRSLTAFALLQSCQNTKSTKEVNPIKKQNSKLGCFKHKQGKHLNDYVLWKCAHGVCFVAARICISVCRKLQRTGKIHKRNKKGGEKAPFSSQFKRYIHIDTYIETEVLSSFPMCVSTLQHDFVSLSLCTLLPHCVSSERCSQESIWAFSTPPMNILHPIRWSTNPTAAPIKRGNTHVPRLCLPLTICIFSIDQTTILEKINKGTWILIFYLLYHNIASGHLHAPHPIQETMILETHLHSHTCEARFCIHSLSLVNTQSTYERIAMGKYSLVYGYVRRQFPGNCVELTSGMAEVLVTLFSKFPVLRFMISHSSNNANEKWVWNKTLVMRLK